MEQLLDVTPQITIPIWLKVVCKLLSFCARKAVIKSESDGVEC